MDIKILEFMKKGDSLVARAEVSDGINTTINVVNVEGLTDKNSVLTKIKEDATQKLGLIANPPITLTLEEMTVKSSLARKNNDTLVQKLKNDVDKIIKF